MAKLIIVEIATLKGAHLSNGPSFLSLDQPPNMKAKSLHRLAAIFLSSWLRLHQRGQRNKK